MKRRIVIVVSATVTLILLSFVLKLVNPPEWRAAGRFSLTPGSDYIFTPGDDIARLQTISNLLFSSACSNELARAARLTNSDFKLIGISGIRDTRGILLIYSAPDRDAAGRAASNACILVKNFYATNDPTLTIKYWDTYPLPPPWKRSLDYWIWRADQAIHR